MSHSQPPARAGAPDAVRRRGAAGVNLTTVLAVVLPVLSVAGAPAGAAGRRRPTRRTRPTRTTLTGVDADLPVRRCRAPRGRR